MRTEVTNSQWPHSMAIRGALTPMPLSLFVLFSHVNARAGLFVILEEFLLKQWVILNGRD